MITSFSSSCASIPNCDEIVELNPAIHIESDDPNIVSGYYSNNAINRAEFARAVADALIDQCALCSTNCLDILDMAMTDGRQCSVILCVDYTKIVIDELKLHDNLDYFDTVVEFCQEAVHQLKYNSAQLSLYIGHIAQVAVHVAQSLPKFKNKHTANAIFKEWKKSLVNFVHAGISLSDIIEVIDRTCALF